MTVSPVSAQSLRCSFCSKSQDEVWKLFAARHAAICDECVEVCAGIMAKEPRPERPPESQTEA
jgi:ATP-dependent Clp protease ATP-binding subunit ClpX